MKRGYVQLLSIGLLMTGIFVFAFSARYPLARYGRLPLQSIATLSRNSIQSALIYIGAFTGLFALYLFGARVRAVPGRRMWLILAVGAILFNLVLLPMYPVDAADIYDYIIRGRMTAVYGLNPMRDAPERVSSDPFYSYAAWRSSTSAYGPAWEVMAAITSRITGDDVTANVIVFKVLAVFGYVFTAFLIGLILFKTAPQHAWQGVYLFTWNPLIVYLTGGAGHNDLWLTAFIVLSVYLLQRNQYILSALAATFGALIKFIPVLMLPIIAVVAWKTLTRAMRLKTAAAGSVLCFVVGATFYFPFWYGMETLAIDRRTHMFTASIATIIRDTLIPLLGEDNSGLLISGTALSVFALFYIWQLVRLNRQRVGFERSLRTLTTILMFYLLAASIWFQPWYVTWIIPLVAMLVGDVFMRRVVLILSYTATWQPLLYNFVTLRYDGWMPLPWRDIIPVVITLGIPLTYLVVTMSRGGAPRTKWKAMTVKRLKCPGQTK